MKPWGTLQVSHGLGEYHKRYRDFAEYLNKQGLIVYCNDHLGHGLHVINGMKKGYLFRGGFHCCSRSIW